MISRLAWTYIRKSKMRSSPIDCCGRFGRGRRCRYWEGWRQYFSQAMHIEKKGLRWHSSPLHLRRFISTRHLCDCRQNLLSAWIGKSCCPSFGFQIHSFEIVKKSCQFQPVWIRASLKEFHFDVPIDYSFSVSSLWFLYNRSSDCVPDILRNADVFSSECCSLSW